MLTQTSGGLMSVIESQIVYLDFDGELTSYNGEILTIDEVSVEDSRLTQERIVAITQALNEQFANQNVRFVSDKSDLSDESDYSTIYIGKTTAFEPYGNFAGVAETMDSCNKNKNDKAFVILDSTADDAQIIETVVHETSHLIGTLDHGGEGLQKYAYSYDVSSGVTSTGITLEFDSMYVYNGGTANSTTVNSGGRLYVSSGGTANSTTVNSYGMLYVYSGGTARNVVFNETDYSSLYIYDGGTVTDVTVQNDTHVFLRGTVSNVTICANGLFECQWGGNIQHVDNYGGLRLWISAVTVEDLTIHSGAYCAAGMSSIVSKTVVESGGTLYLNYCSYEPQGTAIDTYVMAGGVATAYYDTSRFKGYLKIAGEVKICSASVIAEASSIDFELNQAGTDAYLTVSSGTLASTLTITADVSVAYGTYTLIGGGASQIQNITVTNDGVSKQLSVGNTISVTTDKTVQLTQKDSNLYLTVNVNDTTPPALPGNIQSELAENKLSLSWNAVADLTGVTYEIEYSKDSTFNNSVYSQKSISTSTDLMLGNGTWYWRLRAVDGAGNYSAWSSVSNTAVNHTDIVEGSFVSCKTYYGDVVTKSTADIECAYPACIQLLSTDCTVTVEGGTFDCNSIRNACILFGDDAYWVNTYGYGEHYDGTVIFTGKTASFNSLVSYCITAAGIVGKNLTVNFEKDADKSAGITFHAGQGTGSGDYAAAILADENLVINGTFGGTVVSLFDFSLLSDERWAYAEGFGADGSITVNGGISGTILAFSYAPTKTANGYGVKAGYNEALTITETVSGTIAAFGKNSAYALFGGWINATVDGVLIAGKAEAGTTEAQLLSLIGNTQTNRAKLLELSSGYNAVYDYGYGTSQITLNSGAEIFGGISIRGAVNASSGAFISGTVAATSMTITLDTLSAESTFAQGWKTSVSVTVNADHAQNGVYELADNLAKGKNITVVCGSESKTWSWQNGSTLQFTGGKSLTFHYADSSLSITAAGFTQTTTDQEAPDISGVSITVSTEESRALITWNAAADNVGVTQYKVRYALTGSPDEVTETTVSTPQLLLNDLENGSYSIQVQAGDAAGNWSEWSAKQQFTINAVSTEVTLPYEVPQAEYMYGCVATALGMLLGYYDLYGYNGNAYSNIIPGTISIQSRGTDGNAYDMDAFDTVLGNFIASQDYVSRFYQKTAAQELPYTYVNSDPAQGLNVSVFNCLADWLGTGQYWRGNGDLSTTHYSTDLSWLYETKQTERIGSLNIPAKYQDFKWGLDQYLQSRGYKLDEEKTATTKVDVNDGTFTFENYMAEIDAGRPVLISIRSENGNGHAMLGYGYDAAKKTIIFDDTYETNKKMAWNGTYNYSDEIWHLDAVTTIVLEEAGSLAPQGSSNSQSWTSAGADAEYLAEYSTDQFAHSLRVQTTENQIDTFGLPAGTNQWRISVVSDTAAWENGNDITVSARTEISEQYISTANGKSDLFFGNSSGVWEAAYLAQHLGTGSWQGTGEYAALAGKNKITDVFAGSTDANILVLTDDENGDALFVDDIYSAFPAEQKARLSQIDEIRAGAGNDVVDLTSQRFDYTNGVTLRGGDGDDVLWANDGANLLFGDNGNDRLAGASGNDVIAGGAGNDSMHGGGGADIFCFCADWGTDTVEQLSDGSVTLWFAAKGGTWNQETLTYTEGSNSVTVKGALDITLKFGDDGSAQYDTLVSAGAFDGCSSYRIFEEQNKGKIAVL